MYGNSYSTNNIPARAQEVAIRARRQEKELALLRAEYKADLAPIRGRGADFITVIANGLLSLFGLH